MLSLDGYSREDYPEELAERKGMETDPEKAVEFCNEQIQQLEDEGFDTDWIHLSDCFTSIALREKGIPDEKEYKFSDKTEGELVVPNKESFVLYSQELQGQLSDGHWENHWNPIDGWMDHTRRDVRIEEGSGPNFVPEPQQEARYIDYLESDWGENAAARMLFHVRTSGANEDYTLRELEDDVKAFGEPGRHQPEQSKPSQLR